MKDDIRYHPVAGDLEAELQRGGTSRVLILGDDVPDNITTVAEARYLDSSEHVLPQGLFVFETEDGPHVLAVQRGGPSGGPATTSWDAPDDHPLIAAWAWLEVLWESAGLIPQPVFDLNQDVRTVPSGQEARVRGRGFDDGAWWYKVRLDNRTITVAETGLAAPDFDDDPLQWIQGRPAPADRFAATLTRAKLLEQLTDTVYSFRATRTIFRPYQFRPVIRLLSTGSLRLLIADEVGLGKTIEAGLVWTELDARHQADRVLVVCPSMLVPKWRREMVERFGYELDELTREALEEFLERIEEDRLPSRMQVICSLERLRGWDGLERLAELSPRFDLVIVDEAHAFRNSGTRSHALGALLSDWADALVFLSATPLNLGNDDLYNLLELLAPGEFDDRIVLEQRLAPNAVLNRIGSSFFDPETTNTDRRAWLEQIRGMTFGPAIVTRPEFGELTQILDQAGLTPRDIATAKRLLAQLHALSAVVTRTRKVEIQDTKAVREAVRIDVQWTPAEADFYLAFDAWQRERARKKGMPVGFVTQMPLRLASSCLPAARDKVLQGGTGPWDTDLDPTDLDLEPEPSEDIPPPEVVALARRLGDVDTKFDAFLETLLPIVRQGKQVLLFTFSRAALGYLERRLKGPVRLATMHGGVDGPGRHEIMRRFRNREFDVLLASRVASEGLDFEFCSAVVNWDLPWNPMEVEQRIGRIDRFGQVEEKVLILNFHTPGTIETDIIERVHSRIGVFEDSIGELEPILQSKMVELRRAMFDFSLTDDQRNRRINEMLTAFEEQRLTQADLETAQAFLASTDDADIDGFENGLVTSGRYVGQPELVLLLADWAATSPGATAKVSTDQRWLTFTGSPQLENQLRWVQSAGERSTSELEMMAKQVRDGLDIHLCLDQELARTSGRDLLNANHPLVRGALRIPGTEQARFSRLVVPSTEAEPGTYLVLLAIARWTGVRSNNEFWASAVDLATLEPADDAIGDSLLAGLAEAELRDGTMVEADLARAVRVAEKRLRRRQAEEEARRIAANDSLIETRRLSLRETHARKVKQIRRRIDTMTREGKTNVLYLQEAQLASQDRMLAAAEAELERARQGGMVVEHIAVCTAEVIRG